MLSQFKTRMGGELPLPVLPDAVELVRQALLARPELTALVGTRVFDRIPGVPTWPLLVVSSVSDYELRPEAGEARVQVDVWGKGPSSSDKAETRLIAATLVAVARDMPGVYGAEGAIGRAVHASSVPAPDPSSGRHRTVVDLVIHTYLN